MFAADGGVSRCRCLAVRACAGVCVCEERGGLRERERECVGVHV